MEAQGSMGRGVVMLLVVLMALSCAVGMPVSRQRVEVRKQLKRLNKPAVKSIKVGFFFSSSFSNLFSLFLVIFFFFDDPFKLFFYFWQFFGNGFLYIKWVSQFPFCDFLLLVSTVFRLGFLYIFSTFSFVLLCYFY